MKIRWIKRGVQGRTEGQVEKNDDDLCLRWIDAGLAERVPDDTETDAEARAREAEEKKAPAPQEKNIDQSKVVDRSMKGKDPKAK